jgi:hypothetical protein
MKISFRHMSVRTKPEIAACHVFAIISGYTGKTQPGVNPIFFTIKKYIKWVECFHYNKLQLCDRWIKVLIMEKIATMPKYSKLLWCRRNSNSSFTKISSFPKKRILSRYTYYKAWNVQWNLRKHSTPPPQRRGISAVSFGVINMKKGNRK